MRIAVVHTRDSDCACHATLQCALRTLGHDPVDIDADEIPSRARELAALDLIFDHTDRFRGEGLLRPVVRALLDAAGARCVGTPYAARVVADDKAATRLRLSERELPVPPGAAIFTAQEARALALAFPRIVKPAHEHRSRRITVVRDEAEQERALGRILREGPGPCVIETLIKGRELALTVVGNPPGLHVLPAAEWLLPTPGDILGEDTKREGPDPVPAMLDPPTRERLDRLARDAFEALGLADYARFDLRLDPAGNPYVLEANASPSLEPGAPSLVSSAAVGMDAAALVALLIRTALERLDGPGPSTSRRERLRHDA